MPAENTSSAECLDLRNFDGMRKLATYSGEHDGPEPVEVSTVRNSADEMISAELRQLSQTANEYWSFRGRAERKQTQGLTQYPAMMVPAMQAVLVQAVTRADEAVRSVFDPFVGSGTTLVECMRRGLDYTGHDINPLAVLFCKTKSGPFHIRRLESAVAEVVHLAIKDRSKRVEADFPGLNKWFCPFVINELSRIRRAVRRVDHKWCRQVLWTSLAETIRLTSNSRTSTFKLHIRSLEDLKSRQVSPLKTFEAVANEIRARLCEEASDLRARDLLSTNGHYRGDVTIKLCDSTASSKGRSLYDLVITSPPYGDNTSTVPYGQYSYLPLQWIDLEDIDKKASHDYLQSAYEIDRRSLGGRRRNAVKDVEDLKTVSPSLKSTLLRLKRLPPDRCSRAAAFVRDLDASLAAVIPALRREGYMIWTIGNRRIGGQPVPTDNILRELMAARGVRPVARVDRKIPNKRMATKNSIANTMRSETILVFRKT